MTQTQQPAAAAHESRQTRGFFAVIGPGRKAVGDRIEGTWACGLERDEDGEFPSVFTATAPVTLRAPKEALIGDCEECGRIGFFSARGALMLPALTRAQTEGEIMTWPGVRVIDGT